MLSGWGTSLSSYSLLDGMLLRAALYARVSTEDQAKEGFSIPAQLKRLNAYCRARGWEVSSEYVDNGFSGREIKRIGYQRMMEERAKWDVLVVLKMDRIHRNSRNFTEMMDDLKTWGKEFISTQESFDTTTAIGRFVMDIIQRIAQLESEQIGERVKVGMSQKARRGKGYLGFGDPYGFKLRDGKLTPVDNEVEVVRDIYRLCANGRNLQDIAEYLNTRGIPTKKGSKWRRETICHVLTNPLYCGKVRWDGIVSDAPHDPIISSDTYENVRQLIRARARRIPRETDEFLSRATGGEVLG